MKGKSEGVNETMNLPVTVSRLEFGMVGELIMNIGLEMCIGAK